MRSILRLIYDTQVEIFYNNSKKLMYVVHVMRPEDGVMYSHFEATQPTDLLFGGLTVNDRTKPSETDITIGFLTCRELAYVER